MTCEAINKDTFNYLQPKQLRTYQFYILPKIQKEGIEGRQIVLPWGAPTEQISQYVDNFEIYQPKSIIMSRTQYMDFLLNVQAQYSIPPDGLLFTHNITILYNNVPDD